MATLKKSTRKILGRVMGWGIAAQSSTNPKKFNLVEAFQFRSDVREARRTEYNAPNFKVVRISSTFVGYDK